MFVNVVDVNDEAPRFNESSYFLSVAENLPSGTEVGRLVAFDADLSPNDRHTFKLDVTSELSDLFRIDLLTGVIYTRRRLDREMIDSYHLTAVVTGSLHSQPCTSTDSYHLTAVVTGSLHSQPPAQIARYST